MRCICALVLAFDGKDRCDCAAKHPLMAQRACESRAIPSNFFGSFKLTSLEQEGPLTLHLGHNLLPLHCGLAGRSLFLQVLDPGFHMCPDLGIKRTFRFWGHAFLNSKPEMAQLTYKPIMA